MSQYVMNERGTVLPKQTLRSLTPAELNSPVEAAKRDNFDAAICKKFGDSLHLPQVQLEGEKDGKEDDDLEPHQPYVDPNGVEEPTMPEADEFSNYDEYIGSEVLLPNGEILEGN